MTEYDTPAAYVYKSRWTGEAAVAYHPQCLIDEMVNRGELSPAARDMGPEWALNQHAGALGVVREDGIVTEQPYATPDDATVFPQSQWASNELAERECGRCETPILPPLPPITAVQHVARDLAAADLGMNRNDYSPEWCAYADQKFGPQAEQHVVAHEALRQYRETEHISDWALTGAQATEALNRPSTPDSIEVLRARLAAPVQVQHGPRPTP